MATSSVDWPCVGDLCEVLSVLPVRTAQEPASELLAELIPGLCLEVLELGQWAPGLRARVRAGQLEGWVTVVTGGQGKRQLLQRRPREQVALLEDFQVGTRAEAHSLLALRSGEGLASPLVGELTPGTPFCIEELGSVDRRRARITTGESAGWITLVTQRGRLLVATSAAAHRSRRPSAGAQPGRLKKLLESARGGDLAALQRLLEDGPASPGGGSLSACDVRSRTPLMFASAFGHVAVVEYLLQVAKMPVNEVDDTQKTALHHAAKQGNGLPGQADVLRLLCKASAMVDARDHNGCSALMMVAAAGSTASATVLVEAGADIRLRDYEGHRPVAYAQSIARSEQLAELLRVDSDEDSDEDNRATPSVPSSQTSPFVGAPGQSFARRLSVGDAGAAPSDSFAKRMSRRASLLWTAGPGTPDRPAGDAEVIAMDREPDPGMSAQDAERERALQRLKAVTEEATEPRELEAALSEADSAGVEGPFLHAAERRVEVLRERMRAHERLLAAVEARGARQLQEAIASAEEAGVTGADLDHARAVLAEEEPREAARARLRDAAAQVDVDSLRAALREAEQVGLPASEVSPFEDLLRGAESKQEAEGALERAVQARLVPPLRFALRQAQEAGVDAAQVERAAQVLKEEEPRHLARERIAALDETADSATLQAALAEAQEVGLDPADCGFVEELLRQRERQQKALEELEAVLNGTESVEPDSSMEDLREATLRLSAALQAAKAAGAPEAAMQAAEKRRRRLHNMIEDLKGSIRVFCRVRPLNGRERANGDHQVTSATDGLTLTVTGSSDDFQIADSDAKKATSTPRVGPGSPKISEFTFDAVFMPGTQEEVFEDCKDLVQSALDGYNVTMFAYGQTGAGKTFTMYGAEGNEGTTPRTIGELYRLVERDQDRYQHTVMGSMMELYRDRLVDLLPARDVARKSGAGALRKMPSRSMSSKSSSKMDEEKKLNVRVDQKGTVSIEHLTEEQCTSAEELLDLLERGNDRRTVAATAMNSESSRSHLLFIIRIVAVNKETHEQTVGKILMVDLAGSERLKKSEVTGDMQKEAIEINKSLTALGDVIEALTKGQSHIPYKNHKLTQVMQDALGGTSKTLMFVNCSPANSNLDETLMSLKYATRAKTIVNDTQKGRKQAKLGKGTAAS